MGLSGGEVAGIVIGIVLSIVLAVLFYYWFREWIKKRKLTTRARKVGVEPEDLRKVDENRDEWLRRHAGVNMESWRRIKPSQKLRIREAGDAAVEDDRNSNGLTRSPNKSVRIRQTKRLFNEAASSTAEEILRGKSRRTTSTKV